MQSLPVESESAAIHRALSEPSRRRIVDYLRRGPAPRSTAEITAALGLHITTTRAHLAVLVDAGLVASRTGVTSRPGRPANLYELTARGLQQGQGGAYRLLAEMLVDELVRDPAAHEKAAEAGARWGSLLMDRIAPPDREGQDAFDLLAAMFDQLGFSPEPAGEDLQLHTCPFADLADTHDRVICSVHLGMAQGALVSLDDDATELALQPFVTPDLCVLTQTVRAAQPRRGTAAR